MLSNYKTGGIPVSIDELESFIRGQETLLSVELKPTQPLDERKKKRDISLEAQGIKQRHHSMIIDLGHEKAGFQNLEVRYATQKVSDDIEIILN